MVDILFGDIEKEAVKMNDFFDVTDKKEWETLKRIQKINYETGTTPKPYWMEQEEKHNPIYHQYHHTKSP